MKDNVVQQVILIIIGMTIIRIFNIGKYKKIKRNILKKPYKKEKKDIEIMIDYMNELQKIKEINIYIYIIAIIGIILVFFQNR